MQSGRFTFLRSRYVLILSAVFALQAAGFYSISHGERIPLNKPLAELPARFGAWTLRQEGVVEPEIQQSLRADDMLSRQYSKSGRGEIADLFIAYFRSQRQGQAPHSPQFCMPGAGWMPLSNTTITISIPGRRDPIHINRYLLTKDAENAMVLYWYQSARRVVASEYAAKFFLVADALRYNRTDSSLVRVIVPIPESGSPDAAAATGIDFIRSFFTTLTSFFPA